MKDVLTIIMAGGRGERLLPLTRDRCKPAVPFGGIYRLIDIPLSNCVNSQLYKILVFTQYKSQSLVDHLEDGWNIFSGALGHFLRIVAPQQRLGEDWYRGTADSVRQNLYLIERERPKHVLILSGDHVYKMDYGIFRRFHEEKDADVTVSLLEVDRATASAFGIAQVDADLKICGFQEKPADPTPMPDDPRKSLASMGIYLFRTEVLLRVLKESRYEDFGRDIIPWLVREGNAYAYPYRRYNHIKDDVPVYVPSVGYRFQREDPTRDSSYWRDVGSLDAYWNANMDLTGLNPFFNLYGRRWPIRGLTRQVPPAKFVFARHGSEKQRVGTALDSVVPHGCIISGGVVRNSVLSYNVIVNSWAEVDESVVMDNVEVGRRCRIKKAIIDKDNVIPPDTQIGLNPAEDRKHFVVTPRGITVVPRGTFPRA
ncbi:glucose-1-phosphate adenylyltransferase [Desulfacinum infernum DSM 9756]|jgi:glucose-1-phosphate adenylyltransferase|uniref:Glucose-1-phosphate adenylyltransferase n=1 Tax=Desulfacinum infernum DSM 9756 TaxID=1121391 RepID=A0A1M5EBN4_9BACT|nr:glucose-1-phosphate adenylyltransferase [Desulfacinum infernum]SHF76491.1 glucose-1-phosphate adenylyltransferase [Desulfacinum infernum DSM 9756]